MEKRYRIVDLQQGSKQWHDFRRGKIGASMAPIIMGVSPFQTPLQLWEEIVFGTSKPVNEAMQRGIDLESKALAWLNVHTCLNAHIMNGIYEPIVLQSISHPDIIASLDGYKVVDGKPYIVEIKCPGPKAHSQASQGQIPHYYYPQLQHQMDLVGVDHMIYMSFDGEEAHLLSCLRDEQYCQSLFAKELAFLASLLNLKPPEPCDRDWIEIEDSMAKEKAIKYQELQMHIDLYEREAKKIKEELVGMMKHSNNRIGELKLQKLVRKGNIDYEKLVLDYDIKDVEKYRKESIEVWRFLE